MKKQIVLWGMGITLFLLTESVRAGEFEKLGSAISKALGTTKAKKKTVKITDRGTASVEGRVGERDDKVTVFYPKGKKVKKLAVIQKGIYEPNCTHTWVIGMNAKKATVDQIRVVEMSCPHAFPTQKQSWFLEQFKGMGKKDLKKLDGRKIDTVAKATGSSELTADAVATAIRAALKLKGKI